LAWQKNKSLETNNFNLYL